uniref:Uncharacterized protein n=1 Tax=Glossina palpalis gambiensis TaxID=67801 RepID=A0A1B0B7G8_9MUSC
GATRNLSVNAANTSAKTCRKPFILNASRSILAVNWQSDKECIWSHIVGCMAWYVCTFNIWLVVLVGRRNQCKIAIQKSLEYAELPLLPTSSPSPMSPHHNGVLIAYLLRMSTNFGIMLKFNNTGYM